MWATIGYSVLLSTLVNGFELENLCGQLIEVNKSTFHLPKEYAHFGQPWHRYHHAKVYTGEKLLKNWNLIKPHKILGLNETVDGLIRFFYGNRCLFFLYGGAVRDLVLGEYPVDIDGTVTCDPHKQKRLCVFKYGLQNCARPHANSNKLGIGGVHDENDTSLSLTSVDLANWDTPFEVFGSRLEFTVNSLSLYNDPGDPDKSYLIDLTGNSLSDLCGRKIRIPTKARYWNEWFEMVKLYRFSKLRARGFVAADGQVFAYIIRKVKENFDAGGFKIFFCHNFLKGRYSAETNACLDHVVSLRTKQRIENFIKALEEDYGKEFYRLRFEKAILEIYAL